MSELPPPASSSRARWVLPALAVVTGGGVLVFGLRSGPVDAALPVAKEATPKTQTPAPAVVAAPTPAPLAQANPAPVAPNGAQAVPALAQNLKSNPVVPAPVPTNVAPASASASDADAGWALTDPLALTPALAPGEPASAWVRVGALRTPDLSPNQLGTFPRVYLAADGQADVLVVLPEATRGDQVLAGELDGGTFANGQSVAALTVDEHHAVAFRFQAGQFPGTYRVSVRHAAQTKVVNLWMGDRALAVNH